MNATVSRPNPQRQDVAARVKDAQVQTCWRKRVQVGTGDRPRDVIGRFSLKVLRLYEPLSTEK